MLRFAFLAACWFVASLWSADRPAIRVAEIAAPARGVASGASLTRSADGAVWLSWLEREGKQTTLKFSVFDAAARSWRAAETIASGTDWFVNWADFPALTVGPDGHATAVWFVNNPAVPASATTHDHHGPGYHARISRTTDGGRTWSAPAPLTRESDSIEFVSLATLADGRVLAAWLDGRAKKKGGNAQQLFSRIIGDQGPDVLVDPSVCDCCQTSLTAFPDGTALVAYRGRTAGEIRDIRFTRFRGGAWESSRPLGDDGWKIAGCPVNGPQLASDGGRVVATWFTAAEDNARVLTTFSPDAGARFLMPMRLTEKKTLGRVATTLLHHGGLLATFVDAEGGVWLRRVTPDFTAADTVLLAPPDKARLKSFPRLALLQDYAGDNKPAELLVVCAQDGAPGLRTLLVSVPERELLEADNNCDCGPDAAQLRGFPMRGTVVAAQRDAGRVQVSHLEIPGIFAAGTRDFRIAPETLARADVAGRQFLGRIEKRDGAWWLVEMRLIAMPP